MNQMVVSCRFGVVAAGLFGWALLGSVVAFAGAERSDELQVDFARDIRPILSDNCFACHGPDEKQRKAKLRLDTKEGALRALDDGRFIIKPHAPGESEVYRRISTTNPDDKMPPPESLLSLSARQIELIQRWIEQGAEWQRHWAFVQLPKHIEIPVPKSTGWGRNPIDAFILDRLDKEGLQPAPEASKEKLIRRVSFDLTGLPPSVSEVQAFLDDSSPNAYERVVDRMLGSAAFGERLAMEWMDVARYADTHGYQADRYRPVWPWRDWVIKAFNQNLSYDRFITWQLAGDLLPGATKEQQLATAFNRLHMQTEEGGSVEEEFRVAYVVDRVNTAGTAFMGLTLECARCHDHKYDPISQKEFYQLFSFFNNIDESGQTSHFTDATPVPALLLSDDATERTLEALRRQIKSKEAEAGAVGRQAQPAFEQWLKKRPSDPTISGLIGDFSFDRHDGNKVPNAARPNLPAEMFEEPASVEGKFGRALSLSGENGVHLKGMGAFSRVEPFTFAFWMKVPGRMERGVILHRSMAPLDAGSRGYEILIETNRVSVGLHHMWPNNSIKTVSRSPLPTNEWVHLAVTYDGSSRAGGVKLYVNGAVAEVEVVRDNLYKDITYERGEPNLTIGQRFRDNGFKGGQVDELKVYDRALTPVEIVHVSGGTRLVDLLRADIEMLDSPGRVALFEYFQANHNPLHRRYLDELRSVRVEESKLVQSIPEIMAMKEMASPRPAYVLVRGAYDAPGERVDAATPAVLPEFGAELPRNRLGLARWLTLPDHPLTARVTVNRFWQMFFGRGIVASSDNFGSQGELPSHPELLDWLARDFVDSGWDVKRLVKQLVMTAAYRQSSKGSSDAVLRDPENRWLARGPAYRLQAEMIRDNALAASGLLVRKTGGPSVKPYQPEGLWREKSGSRYQQDRGEALYRRSLYTFWKRTVPHPAMIAFDAAERNICVMQRQVTSTPLQALVLLNDTQYVEASRFISERMLREGGSELHERLRYVFQLLTSRVPDDRELSVLERLYRDQLDIFRRDPERALSLLAVGEKSNRPDLDPAEVAAGAVLANALLNYDETVMKR